MKTTAQRNPVRTNLPNSASAAVRKKTALSPPIFLTTIMVKSRPGRYAARLPNSDEYAATGPARYDNKANTRAARDWILRLLNLPSSTPCFFDLDQPARQQPVRIRPKTDYFSICEYGGAMGIGRKNLLFPIQMQCQREVPMSPLQDTLETSMCARNTLPACYGPVKGSSIPL